MGVSESHPASALPVRVTSGPSARVREEDEDLVALRKLRPYKELMHIPPALPFVAPPRPQLPPAPLNPSVFVGLLAELHVPLRTSEALVLDNQRVLQHNICKVEALALRVAHTTRKRRKDLTTCNTQCSEIAQLDDVLTEARARLSSALDSTERLRRLLPPDIRPAPFDPGATTVFAPVGVRSGGFALNGVLPLSGFSFLQALSFGSADADGSLGESAGSSADSQASEPAAGSQGGGAPAGESEASGASRPIRGSPLEQSEELAMT